MRSSNLVLAAALLTGNVAMAAPESTVVVKVSGKVADLPYRYYLEVQHKLRSYLPPEPRLVDLWFRVGYPALSESERDAYMPRNWAISIYSDSVDVAVPMRRGAYFSLPEIQTAYDEHGQIMLNDVERPWLGIWWTLRVPSSQRMAYADIRNARKQIAGIQRKLSAFSPPLKKVRNEPYDGIKACFHDGTGTIRVGEACFHDGTGTIRVGGKPYSDANEGRCKVLFDDPALELGETSIEFSGPLDIVSFIDRRHYAAKK